MGLGFVATVNFLVDPYDLYPPDLLQPITFASHREAAVMLPQVSPPPRILILGTSKVGTLDPAYVQAQLGLPAFNANLNAAKTETLLAYFRYALEVLPQPPELMIVGLDVRAFSNAVGIDEQLINTRQLAREVPEIIGMRERAPVWLRLLNQYQLEGSIESLRMAVTSSYPEPLFHFTSDGRRVWRDEGAVAGDPELLEQSVAELASELAAQYRDFDQLSPLRMEAFEQLVELADSVGTELVVFITPTNSRLRARLVEQPNFVARGEQLTAFVRDVARDRFTFVDLSVPESSWPTDDWLDALHHGVPTGRAIIDRLLQARAR
ncbi:MAG TPA: hypothetical protein VGD06_03650 [Acidobacteriota bacterium]